MKPEIKKLIAAANSLNGIVEGFNSYNWIKKGGNSRLKDTREWCSFYCALVTVNAKLKEAPQGEIPEEQRGKWG